VGHVGNDVCPDDEKQLVFGQLLVKLTQRLNRVAQSTAFNFQQADAKSRFLVDGQLQHSNAMFRRRVRASALEWLDRGRHEPDFIERGPFQARTRRG
jgi:hypothetical protein